jgi:hypothetical protein
LLEIEAEETRINEEKEENERLQEERRLAQ